MTRQNGNAMALANAIDKILNHGTGPMNIPVDDIRTELRRTHGMSLDDAGEFVTKHLSTALDILAERGWSSVKTTTYWEDTAKYIVPGTEPDIKRCVAGIGRLPDGKGSSGVGLHFNATDDDWLWVYARDHGARVWRGKRHKETQRLVEETIGGRLTATGMAIAESSAADPTIGDKPYRKDHKQLPA